MYLRTLSAEEPLPSPSPPCPDCGHHPTLPCEAEADSPGSSRQATAPVIFLAAFLLLGLYSGLVISTYLLYPTLLMVLVAGAALWIRWFQPGPPPRPPLPNSPWHCPCCGKNFGDTPPTCPPQRSKVPPGAPGAGQD